MTQHSPRYPGAAAGVDGTGYPETIQFPYEVTGELLVFEGQLRTLRKRGIKNTGIGPCEQQSGRVAVAVPRNLTARGATVSLRVSHGAQCRPVEQGAIIEMQQEHRCLGRDGIQFREGRQAPMNCWQSRPPRVPTAAAASRSPDV